MADGTIILATKVDNSGFDKDIKELDKKIRIIDEEQGLDFTVTGLEETSKKLEKIGEKATKTKRRIVSLNDGFMRYDTSSIEKIANTYELIEEKEKRLRAETKAREISLRKNTGEAKRYTRQLEKAEKVKINEPMEKLQNSTGKAIKKIGRLVLGVFSIASAYRFASQASSTLAQYDSQYAANLDYIKFALAQGIAPILRYLVNLAGTLLGYLNYILNAWFGINLFSKASAKNFAKGAGSAKEIKNSLAGFDEMNVVSDNSSSSGGGGVAMPSMDLSNMQGEVPEWIKWIAENKDLVLGVLTGIAIAVGAIKLAELISGGGTLVNLISKGASFLSKLIGVVFKFIESLGLVKSIGIVVILAGTVALIEDIIQFLQNPTWEKFGEILTDIGIVLAGIALVIGSIPLAIAAAVAVIVGLVIKNWDTIKEVLGKVGSWIYEKIIVPVGNFFKGLWDGIVNGVKNAITGIKNTFNSVVTFFKNIIHNIINLFKTIGTKVGNVLGSAFKSVINGVLRAIENILNSPIRAINGLISVINKVPGINLGRLSTFNLPRLKVGGIINMPGRGIPIGGAIAGEAGAEGVIPLTDSQAMETLGQAIGKYININLTNITKLNNRQIAKEQKRINNQMDFAYNS